MVILGGNYRFGFQNVCYILGQFVGFINMFGQDRDSIMFCVVYIDNGGIFMFVFNMGSNGMDINFYSFDEDNSIEFMEYFRNGFLKIGNRVVICVCVGRKDF